MFLTGFADEASPVFAEQIAATRELGWSRIESRNIEGKNLASLTDAEFAKVEEQLMSAGMTINCFGSGVANWSRHPRKPEDFEASRTELISAIPRMQRLGIKLIRGMSFLRPTDEEPDNPELEKIIFAKLRELVQICADNGITYGHENCMNYGGLSHLHTLKMLEAVNHPAFVLIFDTGNPCFNYRHIGKGPYPIQSSWEFYRNVREFIRYVHIKDGTSLPDPQGGEIKETVFTWPGEGCADLRAILIDLHKNGYDGGFSIEPHMTTVFHAKEGEDQSAAAAQARFANYVEYGKRFMKLLKECGYSDAR